ncbi:Uncharacterized protein HZ326_16406 [Fusarium oxysporum f. sp. albedinis]|nr:Uncharacterized protein HZ326_16406 [Fusarium oxysporum f. sp. albedinis]
MQWQFPWDGNDLLSHLRSEKLVFAGRVRRPLGLKNSSSHPSCDVGMLHWNSDHKEVTLIGHVIGPPDGLRDRPVTQARWPRQKRSDAERDGWPLDTSAWDPVAILLFCVGQAVEGTSSQLRLLASCPLTLSAGLHPTEELRIDRRPRLVSWASHDGRKILPPLQFKVELLINRIVVWGCFSWKSFDWHQSPFPIFWHHDLFAICRDV